MIKPPADWPLWAKDAYEERAAIMEYDGGLTRIEAETEALELIKLALHLTVKDKHTIRRIEELAEAAANKWPDKYHGKTEVEIMIQKLEMI